MYADAVEDENYLRGVQETDANGNVTFTTIFPAALLRPLAAHPLRGLPRASADATGRHQPPRDLAAGVPRGRLRAWSTRPPGTSRACRTSRQISLDSDMVFSDGYDTQLATVTGSVDAGYAATLGVPV